MLSVSQENCPHESKKLPGLSDGKLKDDEETYLGAIVSDDERPHELRVNRVTGKILNIGPMGEHIKLSGKETSTPKPTPVTTTTTKAPLYHPDSLPHHKLLKPEMATNIVYMVWCGRRWFEFNHYMSVLSAIKHLRPDNIIFYYDAYPILDFWIYNTWFDELKDMYPFLHAEQLPTDNYACADHSTANITFINHLLSSTGGVYLNEKTIITKYPIHLRHLDFVYALDYDNMLSFMSTKRGIPGHHSIDNILRSNRYNSTLINCASIASYNQAKNSPFCVRAPNVFYPKDIWEEPSNFSQLIRTFFYGSPEPVDAKPSFDELIPNIAHVVWIGGGRMDYLFYLGVLSLLYVAEVEVVYIHGNAPPSGELWERIQHNPRIKLIYRETPGTVYGQRVNVLSHVTDIWRVDFMIRYGGIYVDTDTVFVKKLDRNIRGYDAVGSYDWTDWNTPFPDTINFGVAIGKRNAPYWHEFQKSMKWFIDDDWSWNGLRQPYKIKERKPHLVKIDPHLQVICYKYLCHPTWWPGYHNESIHHMNSASIRDWRKDTYAFHWTLPTPPELDNEELLLTSSTMAAEVGRTVLEKAGLLRELRAKYVKQKR